MIRRFALGQVKDLADEALARARMFVKEDTASATFSAGVTTSQIAPLWTRTERHFIWAQNRESFLTALREIAPRAESQIVVEADRICGHVFDLLGSGPTPLGDKIDWHVDFKTGHRWNPQTYYKRIRPAPYPGGYDIKVPWELSRCQHFAWLGQAYWFTEDEKYAQEFVDQVLDWIEQNPPQFGVNWACTMDVAIRVVNWLWGYYFFKDSPSLDDDFLLAFLKSLLAHGQHIFCNLENQGDFTGNHYLSDLVGLVYLGILCPEFKDARRWREFGLQELEEEMFKQVYPDGIDFEASISYHRLVTEMFLSVVILAQLNGHGFSDPFMERLEKMLDFVMYITKPDGAAPPIGDNDNGRLYRLRVWDPPEREWVDFRYLLAIGAVLFEREDFAQAAGGQWEEAIWLLGERAARFRRSVEDKKPLPLRLKSRRFADAGIYVMRHEDLHMVVDAGPVGQNGNGGHAHNDTLSFELYANGQTLIVDSGTYVYTADYEARNQFRSTSYHNVVAVDGNELNRFGEVRIFQLTEDDLPEVHCWAIDGDYDFLDVSHHGYERFENPVVHRRQVFLDKQDGMWIMRDLFTGDGRHRLEWYWHFAPSVRLDLCEHTLFVRDQDNHVILEVLFSDVEKAKLEQRTGWISPGYGVRVKAPLVYQTQETDLPSEMWVAFVPRDGERLERQYLEKAWQRFERAVVKGQASANRCSNP
jgi:uncharacterized heparinase superfamily protein